MYSQFNKEALSNVRMKLNLDLYAFVGARLKKSDIT